MIKPWLLLARVTNRCNANCVYCMHDHAPATQDMEFSLYKKLVDMTEDYVKEVEPVGYGEPLLYPHIVEAVKYARDKGKKVVFYTNAGLLTPELSRKLLEAGLNDLRFSIEADSKEVFEFLRRPLKWETILHNVNEFIRINEEGKYNCRTVIAGCNTKENRSTIKRIAEYWTNLGIKKYWFRREKIFPRPQDLEPRYQNRTPKNCKHLYQYLSVNCNGDILPCCRDAYGSYPIGNALDDNPLDIFNSLDMDVLRTSIKTGINAPKLCSFCMVKADRPLFGEKTYQRHEVI